MDIKQQTQNVAAQGRYGDSMLLHVNPAEVKGLASAMPITVNPETGQPEAFLPFLAPIAGSLLGSSLLAGVGGMSALTAGALGSGLAQYAATGDLKKGLLAGLTGYGLGTAMQGAGAAKAGADATTAATQTVTDAATQNILNNPIAADGTILTDVIGTGGATAGQQVLNEAGQLALQGNIAAAQPAIAQAGKSAVEGYAGTGAGAVKDAFTGNTIGEGFGNLATGLTDPMAYIPAGIGMGGTSIMESQEAFARMVGESEEAYRRRREAMYRDNPEPILYSAEGGVTNFRRGGETDDDITRGDLPQIFAPARQAYDVNPDFMAGFAPETMYFNPSTISAPASGLQAGAPPIGLDTYTGSKGGYGGRQASIAPQTTIDPYSAYTGSAPKGLEFTEPVVEAPYDGGLIPPRVKPITPPDFGIGIPDIDIGSIDIPNIGNIDIQSIIDGLGNYDIPERFVPITGEDLGITQPSLPNFVTPFDDTIAEELPKESFMMTAAELEKIGGTPQPVSGGGLGALFGGLTAQEPIVSEMNTQVVPALDVTSVPALDVLDPVVAKQVVDIPTYNYNDPARLARRDDYFASDRFASASGGSTNFQEGGALKPIPEDNKGLPNLPKDVRNEMGYMQEGGMTDMQSDPLTKEVTMFILGETDNEQALNDFITKYGSDAFMQLREAVLQSIVPNAQTQGLIRGDGEGGMDDDLRGMIGDKERIAVSQDEFIVPADVVSMLGDGSSDAGSKELYDMMDRVRKEKTGTTKQAPRLANAGGLLPA